MVYNRLHWSLLRLEFLRTSQGFMLNDGFNFTVCEVCHVNVVLRASYASLLFVTEFTDDYLMPATLVFSRNSNYS